jgi:uncharacterized membrane protein
MIRSTLKMLALLASFSFVAACGGDDGGVDCTDPATAAAQARGQAIVADTTSGCQSCHASSVPVANRGGAPENITFDDAADITTNEERMRVRALEQKTMPPAAGGGPLNAGQLDDLQAFLDCRDNS